MFQVEDNEKARSFLFGTHEDFSSCVTRGSKKNIASFFKLSSLWNQHNCHPPNPNPHCLSHITMVPFQIPGTGLLLVAYFPPAVSPGFALSPEPRHARAVPREVGAGIGLVPC